jgi:predicted RNase H-like HicB family nuclease
MTVQEYLQLPYSIVTKHIKDESGSYYFATVQELPGCMSDGDTSEAALRNIAEAMELWIEGCLEKGLKVPTPSLETPEYSGKFTLRIPKSLHRHLIQEAKREGVSLNQYATYKLTQ